MPSDVNKLSFLNVMLSLVLVIASLYWARAVLIPFALALLLTFLLQPIVAAIHWQGLRRTPAAVLVVVLASALNAVGEEWLFRRLILQQLKSEGLPILFAITLSSLSFGVAHIRSGLPGGFLGFLLTAAFGAVMGIAYTVQSDGRPFIVSAHFAADLLVIGRALVL